MQQEKRRRACRCWRRRSVRRTELDTRDDWESSAGLRKRRRKEVEIGAKSLARAAVSGLVRATLLMVIAVGRHRPGVGVHGSRADVTEYDEERHGEKDPRRAAAPTHRGSE